MLEVLTNDGYAGYTSYALISELSRKLYGTKLADELLRRGIAPEGLMSAYGALCHVVSPATLSRAVCRDPDDDAVLACGLAVKADLIVTGDSDLLVLGRFEGTAIVTVAQALERLQT